MKLTAVAGSRVTKHEKERRHCKDAPRKYWKEGEFQPISVCAEIVNTNL